MSDTAKSLLELFVVPVLAALAAYIVADLKAQGQKRQSEVKEAADKEEQAIQATKQKQEQEAKLAEYEQRQKDFILELAGQWRETQSQLATTQENLRHETERSNGQERELGRLGQANATLDNEVHLLRAAKNTADQNIIELKKDLSLRSQANAQTREENANLIKERDTFISQIAALESEVENLKKDMQVLKDEHHQQREEWHRAEIPRQQMLTRTRYALREVIKLLSDEQKAKLETALATKDLSYAELVLPGGEAEPPDVDERIQQLRQMVDFRINEKQALVTLLADRGVTQKDVDNVLRVAQERWRPSDDTPPDGPISAIDGNTGEALKLAS